MTTPKKAVRPSSFSALVRTIRARHHCGQGLLVLVCSLLVLSLLAGDNFEGERHFYVAGQVADHDVVADRDMQVEHFTYYGKQCSVDLYNLATIIALGFRMKGLKCEAFRKWAARRLAESFAEKKGTVIYIPLTSVIKD